MYGTATYIVKNKRTGHKYVLKKIKCEDNETVLDALKEVRGGAWKGAPHVVHSGARIHHAHSYAIFIYVPMHAGTYTHTHTYIYMCVCRWCCCKCLDIHT